MNQRGVVAFDFLIAFIMVFAFFTLFFALTMTVTFIETAQYITYSVARSYMAGHNTPDTQVAIGQKKYDQLRVSRGFRGLFLTNWVEVGNGGIVVGDFNQEYGSDRKNFFGARLPLRFRILLMNNPLLGSTSTDDNAFSANIQSFLIREPASSECTEFMSRRMGAILTSDAPLNRYSQVSGTLQGTPNDPFFRMLDNGC